MGILSKIFFEDEEEEKDYQKTTEYEITKKQLCEKLGFKEENVIFIQYEYKTKKLKIKVKE